MRRLAFKVKLPEHYPQRAVVLIAETIVADATNSQKVNAISVLFYGPWNVHRRDLRHRIDRVGAEREIGRSGLGADGRLRHFRVRDHVQKSRLRRPRGEFEEKPAWGPLNALGFWERRYRCKRPSRKESREISRQE